MWEIFSIFSCNSNAVYNFWFSPTWEISGNIGKSRIKRIVLIAKLLTACGKFGKCCVFGYAQLCKVQHKCWKSLIIRLKSSQNTIGQSPTFLLTSRALSAQVQGTATVVGTQHGLSTASTRKAMTEFPAKPAREHSAISTGKAQVQFSAFGATGTA